jgi:hypothetical protein
MNAASLPLWPFLILAGLVMLGYRQSRDRVVLPGTLARVALVMLGLSLYGVTTAFGPHMVPVLAWAAGFAAAVFLGGPLLAPRGLAREGAAVRLPGSWVPLGLMLGIFMTKFGLGFAAGMGAHVLQQAWFAAVVSAMLGLFSGVFAARASAVHRFASAN